MNERTLQQWLDYQLTTHSQAMALGLDRVRAVAVRLELKRPGRHVITVAGTNGKGSVVAFLQALAKEAGLKVGAYTSPHLLRYNERVRIDGLEVDDAALCAAFERIEAARGDIPLTYFEWGTLAALIVFADAGLDLVVLEVGLGGRLDAVNIIDADVAVITTIALDHMNELGADRELIGREKAAIMRPRKVAVLGELDPPDSVLTMASRLGVRLLRRGRDFRAETRLGERWHFADAQAEYDLPAPALKAPSQLANAATAIAALRALVALPEAAIAEAMGSVRLAGRLQRFPGPIETLIDVAHNPQAVQQLARWLSLHRPAGATHAVFAALADKDAAGLVAPMMSCIDSWHLAGLPEAGPRAQVIETLLPKVAGLLSRSLYDHHPTVAEALDAARARSAPGDRIVVYGSFYTVAEALRELGAGTEG